MKNFLKESIDEALKVTGYSLKGLSPLESVFFKQKVSEKFADGKLHTSLFWETLASFGGLSIHEPDAWKWLDEFLLLDEFYIFFEEAIEPTVFIFTENQSFAKFLEEFPNYVFYITNENLDFLIYQNDHDYLRCIGTAEPWLRNKAIELSKTGWKDQDGFYWDENGVKLR